MTLFALITFIAIPTTLVALWLYYSIKHNNKDNENRNNRSQT